MPFRLKWQLHPTDILAEATLTRIHQLVSFSWRLGLPTWPVWLQVRSRAWIDWMNGSSSRIQAGTKERGRSNKWSKISDFQNNRYQSILLPLLRRLQTDLQQQMITWTDIQMDWKQVLAQFLLLLALPTCSNHFLNLYQIPLPSYNTTPLFPRFRTRSIGQADRVSCEEKGGQGMELLAASRPSPYLPWSRHE